MEGGLFGTKDCPSRAIAGEGWGGTLSNPRGIRARSLRGESESYVTGGMERRMTQWGEGYVISAEAISQHGNTLLKTQHAEAEAGLNSLRLTNTYCKNLRESQREVPRHNCLPDFAESHSSRDCLAKPYLHGIGFSHLGG